MRLSTRRLGSVERPYVAFDANPRPLWALLADGPQTIFECLPLTLDSEWMAKVKEAYETKLLEDDGSIPVAPYRQPRKILGIGLNYKAHADALDASYPTSPASFLKAEHTIIGPDEDIILPAMSHKVTAEAEIGLVIGRTCLDVEPSRAMSFVAGIVPVLDQTAEDILRENPRFLTRAKNFPTFLAFGPEIATIDELPYPDLAGLRVGTYRNGERAHEDVVAHMIFSPAELVAFHSQVMPLYPGDVISTGTPGAVEIFPGDVVECRIDGLETLQVGVIDAPPRPRQAYETHHARISS